MLVVHIDHLYDGKVEKIEKNVASHFLDVDDEGLSFGPSAQIEGEVSIVDGSLLLRLSARVIAFLPCTICNEKFALNVQVKERYCRVALDKIRKGVYDYSEFLRQELLLEIPHFAECCGGRCPRREECKKYLRGE